MPRRYVAAFLATLIFAVLSLHASDFWISKDWKQWSRDDCERMLAESPWAHMWRGGPQIGLGGTAAGDALVLSIQLRSAVPVRQAIVRKLQFDQKYDKLTDAQKNSFDTQAGQILNRSYDDTILVHVDFSKSSAADRLRGDLHAYVRNGIEQLDAVLLTDDGTLLKASRFDMNPKGLNEFDLVFPRLSDGASAIKDAQKRFSIQFQSPQLLQVFGTDIPTRRVRVDFDLEKMSFGGKLSY